MSRSVISESTPIKLGLVITVLGFVGSICYFVGTAHARINTLEDTVGLQRLDDQATIKLLSGIDRRLSRIEGQMDQLVRIKQRRKK